MVNRRAKGKILVAKAKTILESQGWLVEVARPKLMFIGPGKVITKDEDFWNCWDMICLRKVEDPSGCFHHDEILLAQVGVWENHSQKKEQVKDFPDIGVRQLFLWHGQGRHGHFRICDSRDDYEWTGKCEMPIKKT